MRFIKAGPLSWGVTGRLIGLSLILLHFGMIGSAAAHRVSVFAWVAGDTVYVESKFSGGRKPVRAPIEVYDSSGDLLLKGETDDRGNFSFKIPRKTEMKVVLLAGMGHRAAWTLPIEELEGVPAGHEISTTAAEKPHLQPPAAAASTGQDNKYAPDVQPPTPSVATAQEIQAAVEIALDKKLKPVLKMLAESRPSGPDLRDIIGGIGYIVGLMGLVAYLKYRRSGK